MLFKKMLKHCECDLLLDLFISGSGELRWSRRSRSSFVWCACWEKRSCGARLGAARCSPFFFVFSFVVWVCCLGGLLNPVSWELLFYVCCCFIETILWHDVLLLAVLVVWGNGSISKKIIKKKQIIGIHQKCEERWILFCSCNMFGYCTACFWSKE